MFAINWNLSGNPSNKKPYESSPSYRLAWMLLSQLHFRLEVPWYAIGRDTSFVNDRLYGVCKKFVYTLHCSSCRYCGFCIRKQATTLNFFFTDHNRHILSVRTANGTLFVIIMLSQITITVSRSQFFLSFFFTIENTCIQKRIN